MRRKKIYYVPGLFSILALPVLLAFIGPEDPPEYVCVRVNLPSDDSHASFSKQQFYQYIRHKKIEEIDFDENHFTKEEPRLYEGKFRWILHEVERIKCLSDTNTVLRLYFTNQSTYGDFAWLCDHMKILNIRRYVLADDCFYILPNPFQGHRPIGHDDEGIFLPDLSITVSGPAYKPPSVLERNFYMLQARVFRVWPWVRYNRFYCTAFVVLILIPFFLSFRRYMRIPKVC